MSRYTKITDGASICKNETTGGYTYYLYTRTDKSWIILRVNSAETEYKYALGGSDADTAWINKASLTYKFPHEFSDR